MARPVGLRGGAVAPGRDLGTDEEGAAAERLARPHAGREVCGPLAAAVADEGGVAGRDLGNGGPFLRVPAVRDVLQPLHVAVVEVLPAEPADAPPLARFGGRGGAVTPGSHLRADEVRARAEGPTRHDQGREVSRPRAAARAHESGVGGLDVDERDEASAEADDVAVRPASDRPAKPAQPSPLALIGG